MKAYIIYIATLLAALALPANGQTGGIDTKYAPYDPAMPYKFSLVTIGGNNGIVEVEDNNPNGGVIFVENDTLIYGSSADMTTTTVKLTVTPNKGYIVREDYPKAYRTDDSGTKVTVTGKASPYTFKMYPYPVTVEIAYAHQIKSIAAITLKEAAGTADAAKALLPDYIHITLGSGRKDSLAVNNWEFVGKSTETSTESYDATDGAANRFKATLVGALPDSLADATTPLFSNNTCTVIVANTAQPLTPAETDKKITISSGNGDNLTGQVDGKSEAPFNGTIESATVKELEVGQDVKDATLTLSGVTVADNSGGGTAGTTTIKGGADLTLKIEGTNNLGTLKVETNATVVLDKAEGASLGTTTIENAGTFIDSTATVTKVKGDAALDINGNLTGGGTVETGSPITLKASTNEGTGIITFTWQKKTAGGSYATIEGATKTYTDGQATTKATAGITHEYQVTSATTGDAAEYRCLIQRTANTVTTLLSTQPAKVEVKAGGGGDTPPPYVPTYHTITLSNASGFTFAPQAGSYVVEEGYNFTFAVTPVEGYTGSAPVVSTSRGETLTPRISDGKYIIRNVQESITVSIASIPTGIDRVETDGIRTWSTSGTLHISTTKECVATIYTLTGSCIRQISLSPGNNQTTLFKGLYLLVVGNQHQKVIVR